MTDRNESSYAREKYIENEYAEFWLENGIVIQVFKPHVKKITLEMGKLMVKDRFTVFNGVSRPLFVDTVKAIDMTKEVRDYFVTEESIRYIN
ncbi:MAG: hypothetical protein H7259_02640, partial [Cytophagales bacterium]|nr:hypothetical protein [Cytophaga sp.]